MKSLTNANTTLLPFVISDATLSRWHRQRKLEKHVFITHLTEKSFTSLSRRETYNILLVPSCTTCISLTSLLGWFHQHHKT